MALHKLIAPDAASGDQFGQSVALSENTALISSGRDNDGGNNSGSTYLFDIATGDLLHKFTAPDAAPDDFFGHSVALSGSIALIGSYFDDDGGNESGSAYLFDTITGNLLHKLIAPDGAVDDRFGWSVALSGNTALVGSLNDDDGGNNTGSAYLFDIITGNLLHKLIAPEPMDIDQFGFSVALSGDTALIGSNFDDDGGSSSGSAYLFDSISGNLLQKFTAPDAIANDLFGHSIALSNNHALIGSPFNDDGGINNGSAYLFTSNEASAVPEPLTILGTGAALGFGVMLRRSKIKQSG